MTDATAPRPKPGPPKGQTAAKSAPEQVQKSTPDQKKPYVFKPHLTARPFKNEQLEALRASMKNVKPIRRTKSK